MENFAPQDEEIPTEFWRFDRIYYLCIKDELYIMQNTQVCRNQNCRQLVTPFSDNPHKLLILSGLVDFPKDSVYLCIMQ